MKKWKKLVVLKKSTIFPSDTIDWFTHLQESWLYGHYVVLLYQRVWPHFLLSNQTHPHGRLCSHRDQSQSYKLRHPGMVPVQFCRDRKNTRHIIIQVTFVFNDHFIRIHSFTFVCYQKSL